ncbi:hypothetical protein MRB53_007616 [Persea americana]|uniref:Uncharacterized protein n=1 Tax=Persea americana TaxID=3435 RepID=A0ACC2MKH4_PERAE|nr:hypothetical protein MRB53_007616 [Persea americana]
MGIPPSKTLLLPFPPNPKFLLVAPSATLSSFAGAEEEEGSQDGRSDADLPGMAKAFHISSGTANSVSAWIAVAALALPFFMRSMQQGIGIKAKALSYVTLLSGFYMAWNIGANDVANAMGTSVGSKALTLRQAVVTAAVLEFLGALLMGTHVTSTMQKGIVVASVFQGKDSLLFAGLLSSLAASGTWLQIASCFGWPVSTTHCIVGAMVGFGLVYGGVGAVFWSSLARVTSSWVISPFVGAAVSFLVYKCIRKFVYSAPNPGQAAAAAAPIAVFIGVTFISFSAFPLSKTIPVALSQALACGVTGAFLVSRLIHQQLGHLLSLESAKSESTEASQHQNINFLSDVAGPTGTQLEIVYGVFGYMQVLSACLMAFAHGGNDVSNAIGLVMWGYRVISTIGKKITELTPTRGFAAEFAAASVVLGASKLGLPISGTHTLVGAVMGVGFARGLNRVRSETVKEIVASWVVTVPVGGILAVFYTWVLTKILVCLV